MANTSVTVRVDEETKREAAKIAEYFGFDLSSVTRAFYKQIVREQRIPLTLEYPEPNEESLQAIEEGNAFLESGKPGRFTDASELIKAATEQ